MPEGVYYYVKEQMRKEGGFLPALVDQYPKIRSECENNVRVSKRMYAKETKSEFVEILFDEIFQHIAELYDLSEKQIALLKQWELEAELENVIPLPAQVTMVKELVKKGETVILISDMYLPKEHISKMLYKADPVLAELPIFLSNEYGVHKASGDLFLKAYASFEPFYDFSHWYHYGDNQNADVNQPRKLNIIARKINKPFYNEMERTITKGIQTYDSYLLAAMQARLRDIYPSQMDAFVIDYISLFLVGYVDWVLLDAIKRGYKCLYFVSRDGYHLKRIADALIKGGNLNIKTRYIYGSRKTWRVPSFVDDIDEIFWDKNGNFERVGSVEKLLRALEINREQFEEFFPSINLDEIDFEERDLTDTPVMEEFRSSEKFRTYLLDKAKKEREIVGRYLLQEINVEEPFAFVDYYGSGFTQDCLIRIWRCVIDDDKATVPFYYSRSLRFTSDDAIRYHFTSGIANTHVMMESVFSNMPYKTVEEYVEQEGKLVPVLRRNIYNRELFESLSAVLPAYAYEYARIEFHDRESMDRLGSMFIQQWFNENKRDKMFLDFIAPLWDSPTMYGNKQEFAPAYTLEDIEKIWGREIRRNDALLTHSVEMSYARSEPEVRAEYNKIYQTLPGDKPASGGGLLTENNLPISESFKEKYYYLKEEAELFKDAYDRFASETEIENKVLFIVNNMGTPNCGLFQLRDRVEQAGFIKTELLKMGLVKTKSDIDEAALRIASAKYILVDKPIFKLCEITFRSETKEILVPPTVFHLNGEAQAYKSGLRWQEFYTRFAFRNDFSVIQIPSEEQKNLYKKIYSHNRRIQNFIPGCCNMDRFFGKKQNEVRARIESVFPEAKGKKIILFAPVLRKTKECKEWARFPDMKRLASLLSDEYVVVINYNRKGDKTVYKNQFEVPGFSKAILSGIGTRDLAIGSDVIVSDYRDIMFESVVLRRPMYSFAYDHEEYRRKVNAIQESYNAFLFCPLVRTAEELAGYLTSGEPYDYKGLDAFRQKYMEYCDGNSVEQVIRYLKEDSVLTETALVES